MANNTHMVRQAITTKFLGPTNTLGSRIKATAAAGSIAVSADHAASIEPRHAMAAKALAERFGWGGQWYQGGMPNGSGYCFVCVDGRLDAGYPAFVTEQKG